MKPTKPTEYNFKIIRRGDRLDLYFEGDTKARLENSLITFEQLANKLEWVTAPKAANPYTTSKGKLQITPAEREEAMQRFKDAQSELTKAVDELFADLNI